MPGAMLCTLTFGLVHFLSGGAVEGSMTGHRKLGSLEIAMLTPPGTFLLEHKDKTPSLPSLAISECPVAERDACPSSARTACL